MTPVVIGTRDDVVGFALAGVDGTVCSTAGEADRALSQLAPDQIVILSHGVASDRIAEWEKSGRGPMFVVLPPR
ncbi:MAG TPA: V-type ATP synthase subunit F [Thermoanaerobaculia bacterium]|nr:V-type ATP synthase subunit F [Thermoanaerobaculia bacterium]